MLLKVGELAKHTGLTVRTLHHYDAIGLLTPSGRSSSGYRLYNADDVARLHAIQALRQLGLPLARIGDMLAADGTSLPAIVAQQIRALDDEIAQARELRARLSLLETAMSSGKPLEMKDWLATLDLMRTYRKYFTSAELRKIFRNWQGTQADWAPLIVDVRSAMARGVRADSREAQQLAHRWMDMSMRWMQGDLNLAMRWGEMYRHEPSANGQNGIDVTMIRYMGEAIELRMAAFYRHLTPEEMKRLNKGLGREWGEMAQRAQQLMKDDAHLEGREAQAFLIDWDALVDQMVDHDPGIRIKLLNAYRQEPLLQMGHTIDPEIRGFIEKIRAARPSTPTRHRPAKGT